MRLAAQNKTKHNVTKIPKNAMTHFIDKKAYHIKKVLPMAKGASTSRGMGMDTLGMLSKVQSPTRKLLAASPLQ